MSLMDPEKLGTDVSFNNGRVNWSLAKQDGVKFAFIRFGQRGLLPIPNQEYWKDPERHNNWLGAKEEKILRAPYYVWDERSFHDAEDHIAGFEYAFHPYWNKDMPELPAVCDLELYPITWDELHEFLIWMEYVFMRVPVIYSGSWVFYPFTTLPNWLADYDWWLTGYNTTGPDLYGPLKMIDPNIICLLYTSPSPRD